jgi:DNA-binding LacI/PurR family transcriptional regulator
VDLDYHEICKHAAGELIGSGHKRILLLIRLAAFGGAFASIGGFHERLAGSAASGVRGRVIRYQMSRDAIIGALDRALDRGKCPTAMIIPDAYSYLTTLTYLLERGVRIPGDMSLICRSDDVFLDYIKPAPSRYQFDASAMSKRLFDLIMRTINGGKNVFHKSSLIMPRYKPGATIAPPARASLDI